MTVTERRLEPRELGAPASARGFRPPSRRRARFAAGAVLAAIGVGGNVLLYTSLDDSIEVVQAVTTIRQGQQIEASDLRIVEVELDATVPVVTADRIDTLIGQYARTFIASGTIVVDVMVQPAPLVTPGQSVVAVEIRPTRVPRDLRERSLVYVVVVGERDDEPFFVTTGRVVSRSDTSGDASGGDVVSVSIEVGQADGPRVAAGDDVRLVLLEPGVDPLAALGAAAPTGEASPASAPAAPVTTAPSGAGAPAPTAPAATAATAATAAPPTAPQLAGTAPATAPPATSPPPAPAPTPTPPTTGGG